jgi:hypothetical protein
LASASLKLFPHHDNDKSEQDRIQHADCRELETSDLVIDRQSIERHIAADQSRAQHCQERAAADNYRAGNPERLARQKKQHRREG